MAKITFIEAAYKVLKEKGTPLTADEITKIAFGNGLIDTSGKTPGATMGARIYMDIKRKGNGSLFTKIEKGKFGLKEWQKTEQGQIAYRKGSFKNAAYQVLKMENKPLSIQEITKIAKKKNLFASSGKTP